MAFEKQLIYPQSLAHGVNTNFMLSAEME